MAACLGTLLASECLSELMPRLTGLPDTSAVAMGWFGTDPW